MYWKIEPYHSRDADYCVMPADSALDHAAALEYAIDRIEAAWDQAVVGERNSVTLELCDGEIPSLCEGVVE